jgi:hypothetical protein
MGRDKRIRHNIVNALTRYQLDRQVDALTRLP